jgi:hypothetical protein
MRKSAWRSAFTAMPESDLLNLYEEPIDNSIAMIADFPGVNTTKDALRRLGVLILHRDVFSELNTGLVFAGFGSKEMFPSLISYDMDGVIAGHLKKRRTNDVQTNRNEITAEIIPFAQRDIVDRYLHGIDPDFERGFEEFLRSTMENTAESVVNGVNGLSKARKTTIKGQLETSSETAVEFLHEKFLPEMKKKLRQQIEDMVLFMPKQELANLAEALVNITSLKRKFSAEQETVAGPIDVAVISKNDGFVWVRRKHYFSPEFNPRYFYRKYGMRFTNHSGGSDDQAH